MSSFGKELSHMYNGQRVREEMILKRLQMPRNVFVLLLIFQDKIFPVCVFLVKFSSSIIITILHLHRASCVRKLNYLLFM